MKKCKSCQSEIADKAKKCPKCQADQRNWFIRHKVTSVILGVIAIAIISSVVNGNKGASTTSSTSSSTAPAANTTTKIGQPASDGKFTFTVNKVTCNIPTVGANQYAQATAQGQYCDLNMTIKNTGTEAQDLSDSTQYLYDAANHKYSADSTADIDASIGTSGTWFSSINPGNAVTGDMYFDLPKGTTPITAELHDSAFSGGTKVSLQ